MYANDRRHSSGVFQPNLYCMLQTIIVFIILSAVHQVVSALNLGIHILIITSLLSIGAMFYILIQRKKVIQRQNS